MLALALGIGLKMTLFTVIEAVMFRPLPVRDSAHPVRFERRFASENLGNARHLFSHDENQSMRDYARR